MSAAMLRADLALLVAVLTGMLYGTARLLRAATPRLWDPDAAEAWLRRRLE